MNIEKCKNIPKIQKKERTLLTAIFCLFFLVIAILITPITPKALAATCPDSSMKQITWSGYTWCINNANENWGPAKYSDSANNVFVDAQGNLHLKTTNVGGVWYSAELSVPTPEGYGTYTTTMVTNPLSPALDSNTVIGIFYFLIQGDEIDIEYARWGDASLNNLLHFGVFITTSTSRGSNQLYVNAANTTNTFVWHSDHTTDFSVKSGNTVLGSWTYNTGEYNTRIGGRFHLNLWIDGSAPSDGQAKEVIFSSFSYTPEGVTPFPTPIHGSPSPAPSSSATPSTPPSSSPTTPPPPPATPTPTPVVLHPVSFTLNPSVKQTDLPTIVTNTIKFILGVAGSLTLIALVIGGIMYMTSAGDEKKATQAKKYIFWVIVGLVAILLSYIMITLIDLIFVK